VHVRNFSMVLFGSNPMTHQNLFLNESGFVITSIAMGSAASFSAMVKAIMDLFYAFFKFPWKSENFEFRRVFKSLLELIACFVISYNIIKVFRRGLVYAEGIQAKITAATAPKTTDED
jgi:uncharacterized membrane protein